MSGRKILATAALAILVAPLSADAQPPTKVYRIGVLTSTTVSLSLEAFRRGLGDLGYIEGKNITIEFRSADGKLDRLPELAAELVRLKVDVIVGSSNPAIIALKQATREIPIVMAVVGDPVGAGFIQSLARPGGNITGLSNIAEELSGKRLQLLKEINPRISRVAVFRNPTIPTHAVLWKETEAAATALGIRLIPLDFRGPDEFESLFGVAVRERAEALIVLPEPIGLARRKQIVDLAAKNRLPGMYPFGEYADAGGLIAYGPNSADLWRRGAIFVDKILKGAKPADLPVEQPTKFELVVNLKTAKALGLKIPQSILVRADRVIE
ncbi:MAG: ABC transporter substrate-binding protein [Candidatus Rokubacteria bacterium]|nr:ABC transporter substrate-binding protein [Candidatus Rokubacteria bacterium]